MNFQISNYFQRFTFLSILIVILIVVTLIPLLRGCATILLQQVPADVDTIDLKKKLEQVTFFFGFDLHIKNEF